MAQDQLSLDKLAKRYGISAALLNRNTELQALFQKILASPKMTDNDIFAEIANSTWGMTHTSQYIGAEKDRASKPAIFEATISERMKTLKKKFQAAGATVPSDDELRQLAEKSIYGGDFVDGKWQVYNDQWMNDIVNSAIDWTKTKTVGGVQVSDVSGTAEDVLTALNALAYEYGVSTTMSSKKYSQWLQTTADGLTKGTIQQADVDDELKNLAISYFPGYKEAAARGKTFREWADPVFNAFANEWETDPAKLDPNNNYIQQALNSVDDKGNPVATNAYQAKLLARKAPEWQRTEKAREEYTNIANTIIRDFGFLG